MKDEKYTYLIYRAYSEKERPGSSPRDRIVFYGWTSGKSVVKAFFEQRDKKKYKVRKILEEDMDREVKGYIDGELDFQYLIDFIKLKSSSTGEDVQLFMTGNELKQAEIKIQEYFRDLAGLVERDNGKTRLLELYINLDDYYLDPLQYIGFNPPEMDALFDSVEYRESDDYAYSIEGLIESRYESAYDVPSETYVHTGLIPGFSAMPAVSNKILYSIESFIKVMKEDL